jgi:hypothetical protein
MVVLIIFILEIVKIDVGNVFIAVQGAQLLVVALVVILIFFDRLFLLLGDLGRLCIGIPSLGRCSDRFSLS